ncbi:hypothetical protein B5E48_05030 [Massilimicrobiota sp. An105]|uniref:glycosyltransferase n=1 Tax=Massilimicrobiota sp. An105 TaxID=1965540 RepID=UPI000B390E18|nr:glycosyltransferase [Massilimicrobiota sp. An105]OUQ80747.1 hypothetical protein B5E48_05030 [Massilimicrobiota sp. An105]
MNMLSIIVPVYNVEKYIDRCMENLLHQEIDKYEILLIDDGSTDKSGDICDKYAKENNCVRVFHIENGGVSNARNFGIEKSTGEYVAFVDSDDGVAPNIFAEMLRLARDWDYDIVQCNFIESKSAQSEVVQVVEKDQVIDGGIASIRYIYYPKLIHNSVCTKIFKRSMLKEIRFDNQLSVSEDLKFTFECCMQSKKIMLSQLGGYIYYIRDDSVTHQIVNEKHLDCFKMNDWALKQVGESKELVDMINSLDLYQATQMFYSVSVHNSNKKYLDYIKKRIQSNPMKVTSVFDKIFVALINFSVPLAVVVAKIYYTLKHLRDGKRTNEK